MVSYSDKIEINRKNEEYVRENLESIKVIFNNRFVIVHDQKVEAGFDTYEEASRYGIAKYGVDDVFLIYEVSDAESVNNFVAHALL